MSEIFNRKASSLTPRQAYIQREFWRRNVFVIMDTETNGLDPEMYEPCEVAMLKIVEGVVQEPFSWYVKPKLPIPPHVQAVHHISNSDVADAKSMAELAPTFQEFCVGTVVVAHNAPFDYGMMPCLQDEKFLWVDNLSLARHQWPLGTTGPTGHPLTAHKNKILQHWLDIRVDTRGQAAHRAQADILVTAEIFKEAVNQYLLTLDTTPTAKQFAEYLDTPCKVDVMNFGPYKDLPIEELPTSHIRSILSQHKNNRMTLGNDLLWTLSEAYKERTQNTHLAAARQLGLADATQVSSAQQERLALQAKFIAKQANNPQTFNTAPTTATK